MKLWKKIVLIILALILAATAVVVIWQWENISALYLYATSSGDDIKTMVNEANTTKEEVIGKYDEITVSDLTPEQEGAIISGEKTAEEVVAENEEKDNAAKAEKDKAQGAKPADKRTEIVNRYLKQIYAVGGIFGKIGKYKGRSAG